VATYEGAKELISLGVDGVKVGIGPGSICTRAWFPAPGVPQITAILECARPRAKPECLSLPMAASSFPATSPRRLPPAPTRSMIGSLLAGTDESPGETILYQGRTFKTYRAWARRGPCSKAAQTAISPGPKSKLVPEGIEGRVAAKGPLPKWYNQLVGGLRSGMGYCGARDIGELQRNARFMRISSAGLRESHVHRRDHHQGKRPTTGGVVVWWCRPSFFVVCKPRCDGPC